MKSLANEGRRRGGFAGIALVLVAMLTAVFTSTPATATPGAPLIDEAAAAAVGFTGATLRAQINAQGVDSTYHFEYGTGIAYGASAPMTDQDLGAGSGDVAVSQTIDSLQPGVTYHYRAVATNANGTTEGADHVLRTFAQSSGVADSCPNALIRGIQFSSYLPDCRAYEMVSPAQKNGANIATDPSNIQAATNGNAIKYGSVTAFGDAQGIETRGAEYVSQREAGGWSTRSINPEQSSTVFSIYTSPQYLAFSEDLTKGVFFALRPLTSGHPNVETARNLYLRNDVLDGPGHYELLSDSVNPLPAQNAFNTELGVQFAGASADWSRILIESSHALTADAAAVSPSLPKLYEWHNGVVSLVGVLPDSACGTPPCPAEGSVAGDGAGGGAEHQFTQKFYTASTHAISADGSRVIFEGGPLTTEGSGPVEGNLYMRINGTSTIQLNLSERSTPDPNGAKPAAFQGASADGSKVLFLSAQALTDNASGIGAAGSARNLYMYNVNAPAGHHLTLVSEDHEPADDFENSCGCGSDRARAVVGVSPDLSYVYFVGENQLVAGQPPISQYGNIEDLELYVWHEGAIRPIVSRRGDSNGEWFWGQYGISANGTLFRTSADGKEVVFATGTHQAAALVGYDNHSTGHECLLGFCEELYVYNYEANKLTCASCDPSNASPVSDASFESKVDQFVDPEPGSGETQYLSHPLSNNGRYVFFDTGDALVPEDTNGKRDVYEYDTQTGRVSLLSSGSCDCNSYFVDATPDAHDVFITTRQQLVRADVDTNADLYDVRIEGGIAAQNQAAPAPCEGDDCQGPAGSAPVFSLPASSTFAGTGNVAPAKPLISAKPKSLTRAQQLARALKACKKKPRRKRAVCKAQARKKFKVKQSGNRVSRRAGR